MLFKEVGVAGAFVLTPQRREDERGYFARIHCEQELAEHGLVGGITQINTGFNPRAGTLRGMHFQRTPHAEVKIMRCVRGAVYDVIVDLRPASPTFKKWYGIELRADSGQMLYAPEGTAHGYLTLADETELIYMANKPYAADAARGLNYADPAINIAWPGDIRLVSQADRSWPPFGG